MKVLVTTVFGRHRGGLWSHIEELLAVGSRSTEFEFGLVSGDDLGNRRAAQLSALVSSHGNLELSRQRVWEQRINVLGSLLRKVTHEQRCDLVHAHDPISSVAALRHLDLPVVTTIHGPMSRETRMLIPELSDSGALIQFLRAVEHESVTRTHRLIAVDSGMSRFAVEECGAPAWHIDVIHNAVDAQMIRAIAQSTSVERRRPFLLVPRRLVKKNGVDVAIRAMAYVANRELQLVIAGDGREARPLQQLATELEVAGRIQFLGSVDRSVVVRHMAAALAVVIPSRPSHGVVEATSIAALEAMALGRPVIASNIGGLAELIEDQVSGILVDPGSSRAIAAAVDRLLEDPDHCESLGAAATDRVDSHYGVEQWFNRIAATYHLSLA